MLVSKNAKMCVTPNTNANICVIPNDNPNASRGNIGSVGSQMRGTGAGHVHFMFFCVDFICVG